MPHFMIAGDMPPSTTTTTTTTTAPDSKGSVADKSSSSSTTVASCDAPRGAKSDTTDEDGLKEEGQ